MALILNVSGTASDSSSPCTPDTIERFPSVAQANFKKRPHILNFWIIRVRRINIKSLTIAPCKLGWRVSRVEGVGVQNWAP
jgi:hypothetical protein